MGKIYYAVRKGRTTGILDTWDECLESIDGYPGAEFRGFKSKREATAFLNEGKPVEKKKENKNMSVDLDFAIPGVNKRTSNLLKKLKINSVEDLLRHYPRRYETHPPLVPIAFLSLGRHAFKAQIDSEFKDNSKGMISLYLNDGTGKIKVNWFHTPYIMKILKWGMVYVFEGEVKVFHGHAIMMQPDVYTVKEYQEIAGSYTPVYGLTKGLSNKTIFNLVLDSLKNISEKDTLPSEIIKKYGLISKPDAIRCIHYPYNMEVYEMARKRIAFEEFYDLIYALRTEDRAENSFVVKERGEAAEALENALPYDLTGSQRKAVNDILQDFASDKTAQRLVQGDVGSGKTVVAFLSMLTMADHGWQAALMAPTEVLATQHYDELMSYMKMIGKEESFCPVLLTSSTKGKKKILDSIASGKSLLIVGTHAVIQEAVTYHNLGLVIIDEQHRFGVEQRRTLCEKGNKPHMIAMSATPIPRTTGHILYGSMDISIMNEKPANRLPIENLAVGGNEREKAYDIVKRELENGHQVYMICPMVSAEEDDKKSVQEYAAEVRQRFPGYNCGELFGKMEAKKKQEIMDGFSRGDINILVSTTVVEVGVNVPNATVILIENANMFGLLQLHQLRGRVGRGKSQSYCVFVDTEDTPCEKLQILEGTNNGFEIAEADYRMRKAGKLLGTEQSGDMGFRIADIFMDEDILKMADEAVNTVLSTQKE